MNLYFIVEGDTEKIVYVKWLSYLLPELKRIDVYSDAQINNYFLISGNGYPALYEQIEAAVEEISICQVYDYLIVCTDADENTVNYMEQEIADFFSDRQLHLGNTNLKIIIQNRCIETWFLGNSNIYSRQPPSEPLLGYSKYYNVSTDCPELMGKNNFNVHAKFHEDYLKKLFEAKNRSYSKTKPRDAQEEYYLQELRKRIDRQPSHLPTFKNFIDFCMLVRSKLKT